MQNIYARWVPGVVMTIKKAVNRKKYDAITLEAEGEIEGKSVQGGSTA